MLIFCFFTTCYYSPNITPSPILENVASSTSTPEYDRFKEMFSFIVYDTP